MLQFLVIFGFLLTFSQGLVVHSDESRIIKGFEPQPKDIPFQVGVMLHFEHETGWCGGVLISQRYVLTSASCVKKAPSATVLVGATNINKVTEVVPVVNILYHPKFSSFSYKNDIAMLTLARPVKLGEHAQAIRVPTKAQKKTSFKNAKAVTAGWGKDGSSTVIPRQNLLAINLTVIGNTACKLKYPLYINSKSICTDSGKGTPCDGDQGGALYVIEADNQPTLIGIVSYQFSLGCTSLWPAVYTRISYYLDWIAENSDVVVRDN